MAGFLFYVNLMPRAAEEYVKMGKDVEMESGEMQKTYDYYFFDLDGTITDSSPGIVNSLIYALDKLGIRETDRQKLCRFIGPPMIESFQKFYGMTEDESWHAIDLYREYYNDRGIFENSVYDGLEDVFCSLRERGKHLAVATSKPLQYAKQIITHFSLDDYFDAIAGAEMDYGRSAKSEVIRYAMDLCGVKDPADVLMVGDREYDVNGAKEAGMDCLGVLYGFGSRRELENAGAAYIAETVEDILQFV